VGDFFWTSVRSSRPRERRICSSRPGIDRKIESSQILASPKLIASYLGPIPLAIYSIAFLFRHEIYVLLRQMTLNPIGIVDSLCDAIERSTAGISMVITSAALPSKCECEA